MGWKDGRKEGRKEKYKEKGFCCGVWCGWYERGVWASGNHVGTVVGRERWIT